MNNDPPIKPKVTHSGPIVEPDSQDFYYDGPYLVFTAAYHRKRGYCCGSGCRHCPYQDQADDGAAKTSGLDTPY